MFDYTEEEKNTVLIKYFESRESLRMTSFPKKQKQKYLCLLWIKTLFNKNIQYAEKEVNEILKPVHDDYVMIRRYLVDYGLLLRETDGSKYWV